ncbi:hypothetical protein [Cellvibrio sp. PSBB023]|uniref:hypothetical protein n=1 Tax=Cellvibrio sp. PSBB023 TaxID=1945512 RepID=UPI00098FA89E|nr:hypothetical protein [Cellvibrio sp. PSBB023]AQT62168.1 hypothetical protein B0D95_20170 [Cellvibrio sp. PSBB023]
MDLKVIDIHNTIKKGLCDAWLKNFILTGERDDQIKPEYLTTAAVCYAFSDFIENNQFSEILTIRAEEKTRSIWIKSLLPLFLIKGNRRGHKKESKVRKGNVDITLAWKGRSICELPFGVIENKGFLHFREDKQLYNASYKEVVKDLKRNIDFVAGFNGYGVEYSGFTFYLRDDVSVLEGEGLNFCQNKEMYFRDICNWLTVKNNALNFKVEILTIESNLYPSLEAANEVDESGCPAYTRFGHWHFVCGVISIYRVGNSINHS